MSWGSHSKTAIGGMYADHRPASDLSQSGRGPAEQYASDGDSSAATTTLTSSSAGEYEHTDLTVDWPRPGTNLALAQAVLTTRRRCGFASGTTLGRCSATWLFGLMHRIYPIDADGERVGSTDQAAGYEAVLDGRPSIAVLPSQKYGIPDGETSSQRCRSVTGGRWLPRLIDGNDQRRRNSRTTTRKPLIRTTVLASTSIATSEQGRSRRMGAARTRTGAPRARTTS